ncbi:MAG TPA: 2-amino-4-hydroxy-6-hydroxymethyldihydropteridine diphosphokinase [Acidimicrobiales bacterium]|nr:2-amino-4-hydroxy-6-hydroxymethyldihydropteridine diphosphokinase [Acidimicrobiales bacterium]
MRAFVGLGSNLGDRISYLKGGVAGLPDVIEVSPVYESEAMGGPEGQPPYLNVVVRLETEYMPRQLLGIARGLESTANRVRGERWGPRTLDVDILIVGNIVVNDEDLVVPHPRIWERPFVIAPLADLASDLVRPAVADEARTLVTKVASL